MPIDIITTKEMRALDINAEYFGISRLQLMENAGRNISFEVSNRFKSDETKIAIFCGLGGNGGDGFVAARHLATLGFKVDVFLGGNPCQITDSSTRVNWIALKSLDSLVSLFQISDSSFVQEIEDCVAVDALLGIGLKNPPRPPISRLIHELNNSDVFRIAVDIPSGLDSESGKELGEAINADLTVTFHKVKPGLLKAKKKIGELVVRKIGIPEEVERFAGPGDVNIAINPRSHVSHKGDFGRLLVIGGSKTYSGAPALAALAALRTGIDLAFVAAPHETAYAISSISPDIITLKLDGDILSMENLAVVRRQLEKVTAVILGPGLGTHTDTNEAVKKIVGILETKKIPTLIDADGLKSFSLGKHRFEMPCVITPHSGEYELLIGSKLPSNLLSRVESVQHTSQDLNAVTLLKSHVDIISDGYKVKMNYTGNPGMTVGGTGDVLSGIVGGFLAKGIEPFEAAVAGTFVSGAAGDFVVREKGYNILASDLLEMIPTVINNPMSHQFIREERILNSS